MRRTEFDRLVAAEFGRTYGSWLLGSHVLSRIGSTSEEAIEAGVDPRKVWWELCRDFEIPEERQLGPDD